MVHNMSLNNRISCVVVISIFGFKKYWKTVFNLMELNMSPTFKQLLQAETVNDKINKAYYQRYDVKIVRAFHEQAMMKQKIYKNILARQMDCSPGIRFETSLVNVYNAKALTMSNQPKKEQKKRCRCGSITHL